jgi:hypothetical protein
MTFIADEYAAARRPNLGSPANPLAPKPGSFIVPLFDANGWRVQCLGP